MSPIKMSEVDDFKRYCHCVIEYIRNNPARHPMFTALMDHSSGEVDFIDALTMAIGVVCMRHFRAGHLTALAAAEIESQAERGVVWAREMFKTGGGSVH